MKSTKEVMQKRILFIKNNLHIGNIAIAKKLNTTPHNISVILTRNNIKRPKEIVNKMRTEAAFKGSKVTHSLYKFDGENNPNWKGGISKDNYRYKKIQKQRYPERILAREKVHREIRSGRMKRLPCQKCGKKQSFAHHTDYSKPLDVEWYCRKHHREQHDNKH